LGLFAWRDDKIYLAKPTSEAQSIAFDKRKKSAVKGSFEDFWLPT